MSGRYVKIHINEKAQPKLAFFDKLKQDIHEDVLLFVYSGAFAIPFPQK